MSYYHKDIFDNIWILNYQVRPGGIIGFRDYVAKDYQDFLRSIGSLEEKSDKSMLCKIDEATRRGCIFHP